MTFWCSELQVVCYTSCRLLVSTPSCQNISRVNFAYRLIMQTWSQVIIANEHASGTRGNVSPIILLMTCIPWEMNRVQSNSDDVVPERSGVRRRKISPPDVRRDYDAKWIIWRKRQNGRVISLTKKNYSLTSFIVQEVATKSVGNQTE